MSIILDHINACILREYCVLLHKNAVKIFFGVNIHLFNFPLSLDFTL